MSVVCQDLWALDEGPVVMPVSFTGVPSISLTRILPSPIVSYAGGVPPAASDNCEIINEKNTREE